MNRRTTPESSKRMGLANNPSLKIHEMAKMIHRIRPNTTAIGTKIIVERRFLVGNMIAKITIKDSDVRVVIISKANQS